MLEVKQAVGESRQNGIPSERFSSHVSWEQQLRGVKATVRPMLYCPASLRVVSASPSRFLARDMLIFDTNALGVTATIW
jgi:hypothetical protein